MNILLLILIAPLGFQSCQSEYGERMSKAMELKRQYQQVQHHMDEQESSLLKAQLSNIEKEIEFHAALSGNESLFLEEIWNN